MTKKEELVNDKVLDRDNQEILVKDEDETWYPCNDKTSEDWLGLNDEPIGIQPTKAQDALLVVTVTKMELEK
ncbi:23671_t:CDS:2 [Gigaspora margarita]|uniref:23671_t:CDS:1 n=1 Tax=Gigaspora margarita TaxID=4874 RepID=A0ABN7UG69_GIGMA|nr:23671_t:CDS:2 [Gigaspora margarita]